MIPSNSDKDMRSGVTFALAAFGFWGVVQPYYFGFFEEANAVTIMAHRSAWSCIFVWIWLGLREKISGALELFKEAKMLRVLFLTGVLIAGNWGIFIYAVQSGRVLDASLGYFMTPLMTAAFGILVLKERPRKLQILALMFAAIGVGFYTVSIGQLPLIALAVSISFSAYSGIRKLYKVPAERGMALETTLILPFAVGIIGTFGWLGAPYLIASTGREATLLIASGLTTLLPLVWFNAAAARMPLISIGLLQFIVPIMLLVLSLFPPLEETLDLKRGVMLAAIWVGLVFYIIDVLHHSRRSSRLS